MPEHVLEQNISATEETTLIDEDDFQLDVAKACLLNDPDCEACQ